MSGSVGQPVLRIVPTGAAEHTSGGARPARRDRLLLAAVGVASVPGYVLLHVALAAGTRPDSARFALAFGLLFALYLVAARVVLRARTVGVDRPSERPPRWWGSKLEGRPAMGRGMLWVALALAVLFRLILLPGAPVLSGDPYRYVWDARLLTHHVNPYLFAPDDPHVRFLRDHAIYDHTGWHGAPTIYPPGAQYLFALTYLIAPDNVIAIKLALLAFEAVTVVGLLALLRARGQDPARVLLYAWNPLAVLEIAGSGHIDAAAAAMIVLALLAQRRGRPAIGGALIGLATLFKLFPFALLAAFDRRDLKRAVPAALATVALGYLPFVLAGGRSSGYLGAYLANQDANQWLYVPAHLVATAGVRHLLHTVPLLILLGVLATIALRRFRGTTDTATAGTLLLGSMLLFSPSMFPWYLLTLLPLLPLVLRRRAAPGAVAHALWSRIGLGGPLYLAPVLFSGSVITAYGLTTLTGPLWWVGVLGYLPLYVPLALALYASFRRQKRARLEALVA